MRQDDNVKILPCQTRVTNITKHSNNKISCPVVNIQTTFAIQKSVKRFLEFKSCNGGFMSQVINRRLMYFNGAQIDCHDLTLYFVSHEVDAQLDSISRQPATTERGGEGSPINGMRIRWQQSLAEEDNNNERDSTASGM